MYEYHWHTKFTSPALGTNADCNRTTVRLQLHVRFYSNYGRAESHGTGFHVQLIERVSPRFPRSVGDDSH